MKVEKIITLANNKTRIQFLVMERSLRAVGCTLPLWVIPYDDNLFDLPEGSVWWQIPEITEWLNEESAHPTMRKYQCLTIQNYQFVDTDVCFLRNPVEVLATQSGFITSCGHWHNPNETLTAESKNLLLQKSTVWQQTVFNTGQFACGQVLYSVDELKRSAMSHKNIETTVRFKWHEQPGLNLLVSASGVEVSNLTLPPIRMESTWAGDYPGEYESYWTEPTRKPYLIHWAGGQIMAPKPINNFFYQYLSEKERIEWGKQTTQKIVEQDQARRSLRAKARRIKRALKVLFDS